MQNITEVVLHQTWKEKPSTLGSESVYSHKEQCSLVLQFLQLLNEFQNDSTPFGELPTLPVEVANNAKVVWVVSGSGTLELPQFGILEIYKNFTYDWGTRLRMLHGEALLAYIACHQQGLDISNVHEEEIRQAIIDANLFLFFNGLPCMCESIQKAAKNGTILLPESQLLLCDKPINIRNTEDQVKKDNFIPDWLLEELISEGKYLIPVTSSFHYGRVSYYLAKYNWPQVISIFPSLVSVNERHASLFLINELKGLLALSYDLYGKNG